MRSYTEPDEGCKFIAHWNITIGHCTRCCRTLFRLFHIQIDGNVCKFVPCGILVGAPNESRTNGSRTRAVYQCELGSGDNNCSRVVPFDSYTGDANTACIKNMSSENM